MRLSWLAVICVSLASCQAASRKHAVNAIVGLRSYGDSDFDEVDDQTAYGVEGLLGLTKWGLGIEGGYQHAEEDKSGVELEADELYVGVRETLRSDKLIQPYFGGGVTWLSTDVRGTGFSDDDDTPAGYGRAGVGFCFGLLQVGVDYRVVLGSDVDYGSLGSSDVDFQQLSITAGLSF